MGSGVEGQVARGGGLGAVGGAVIQKTPCRDVLLAETLHHKDAR